MYTYDAKVLRVIDGDTVDLEIDLGFHITVTKRARLSGIDTYEKKSKFVVERELSAKATSFVKNKIENKHIKIKTELDHDDKYGRVLAEVYANDADFAANNSLNVQLIQEKLAVPYDGGKKTQLV